MFLGELCLLSPIRLAGHSRKITFLSLAIYTHQKNHTIDGVFEGIEKIEQAIKGLPLELRKILKARYVSHPYASQNQLAHHLRKSTNRLETDLIHAKKRLQDELDKRAKSNHYESLLKVQPKENNKEWDFSNIQSWDE